MKVTEWIVLGAVAAIAATGVYAKEEGKGAKSPGTQSMKQMQSTQHMQSTQQMQMQQQHMQQLQLRNIDTDGDGNITQAEVQAHERLTSQMRQQWDTADANKDGHVDTSEFAAFRERVNEQLQEEIKAGEGK